MKWKTRDDWLLVTLAQPGEESPAPKLTTPSKSAIGATLRKSGPLEVSDFGTPVRLEVSPRKPVRTILTPADPASVMGRPLGSSKNRALGWVVTWNAGVPLLKVSVRVSPDTAAEAMVGVPLPDAAPEVVQPRADC